MKIGPKEIGIHLGLVFMCFAAGSGTVATMLYINTKKNCLESKKLSINIY